MGDTLLGIAEMPSYTKLAEKYLDALERQDLIDYLAEHPRSGDIMLCQERQR